MIFSLYVFFFKQKTAYEMRISDWSSDVCSSDRNALARAPFFNQLGELRDRRFENQTYRASGLNLLVAAIILWNTRYLEMALADIGTPDEIARQDRKRVV